MDHPFPFFLLVVAGVSGAVSLILYSFLRPERFKRSKGLAILESILALAVVLGLPFYLLGAAYDAERGTYPDGGGIFLSAAFVLALSAWHFVQHQFKAKKPRHLFAKMFAGILAFLVLFMFLLGPMFVFRLANGIGMDEQGPDFELWFLVIGGALGVGVAGLVHTAILRASGHFSDAEISAIWRGEE